MSVFVWATIILGVWGALAPFVGILVGHRLTSRWQKKQWLLENKKQEYREIVQSLSMALTAVMQTMVDNGVVSGQEMMASVQAVNLTHELFNTRLFIGDELEQIQAHKKWISLVDNAQRSRNTTEFAKGFDGLMTDIKKAAARSIQLT